MSRKIWQPEHPTPGWLQAEKDSDLTIYLPHPDGDVPMFFRRIPAREFRMGSRGNEPSEEPVHRVVIPEDFYLGTFPVIQAQYRAMATACLADLQTIEGNDGIDPSTFTGDSRPVENVSWDDATLIATWLSASGLLPNGWHAGLPNEAQWEYACRAGTETGYWNGDGEAALAKVAWNDEDWESDGTEPVGELLPNKWSIHNMHGSVWEWCADVYDPKAYRKRIDGWTAANWSEEDAGKDAEGKENARNRVTRGGARFVVAASHCRSAYRGWLRPSYRVGNVGFRLCVFPGSVKQGAEAKQEAESVTASLSVDLQKTRLPPHPDTPRGAWRNGCGGAPSSNEPSHE